MPIIVLSVSFPYIYILIHFVSLEWKKTTKPVKAPATAARTIIPELILLHIIFVTEIKAIIEVTL